MRFTNEEARENPEQIKEILQGRCVVRIGSRTARKPEDVDRILALDSAKEAPQAEVEDAPAKVNKAAVDEWLAKKGLVSVKAADYDSLRAACEQAEADVGTLRDMSEAEIPAELEEMFSDRGLTIASDSEGCVWIIVAEGDRAFFSRKLTGEEWAGLDAYVDGAEEDEEETGPDDPTLTEIKGIGAEIERALINAGYDTKDKLREASDDELLKIPGIGVATLKEIRSQL